MILKTYRKEQRPTSPECTETETIMISETIDGIEKMSCEQFGDRYQDTKHKYVTLHCPQREQETLSLDLYDDDLISAYLMAESGQTIEVLKRG